MAELKMKCIHMLAVIFAASQFCSGQEGNCTEGDLRLYNSSAPGHGMLQECSSANQWTAICNNYWYCGNAAVACRQLGFSGYAPAVYPANYFGNWDGLYETEFFCSGQEESLPECYSYLYPYCASGYGTVGLGCHSPSVNGCTDGDLRLVGEEASETQGLVEVCYDGGWYSVCYVGDEEASVICKQLGHAEYPWTSLFNDGRFGQTSPSHPFLELYCNHQFNKQNWTECSVYISCYSCPGVGIKCFDPSDCEEGSVRLVNGVIDNEGRVEVCLQGVWGTINSQDGWSSKNAYFVCKLLKLGVSIEPEAYTTSSKFGDGLQPQVMQHPTCSGLESSLIQCDFTPYGSFYPSRTYTAGILCFDDCEDGEVRLVDGDSDSEGTVEVCVENLWGLVAETLWSHNDAQVVCKQLGFPSQDVHAVTNSHYGKPRKPVHFYNFLCVGVEEMILSCTHAEFTSLDEKKEALKTLDVAGVICQSSSTTTGPSSTPSGHPATTTGLNDQSTTDDESGLLVSLVIPVYIFGTLLTMGLILAIILAIVGMRMYWKKKTPQSAASSNFRNQVYLENERSSIPSHYEMRDMKPLPSTSHAPASVKITSKNQEKDEFGPLCESTDHMDGYSEMS